MCAFVKVILLKECFFFFNRSQPKTDSTSVRSEVVCALAFSGHIDCVNATYSDMHGRLKVITCIPETEEIQPRLK